MYIGHGISHTPRLSTVVVTGMGAIIEWSLCTYICTIAASKPEELRREREAKPEKGRRGGPFTEGANLNIIERGDDQECRLRKRERMSVGKDPLRCRVKRRRDPQTLAASYRPRPRLTTQTFLSLSSSSITLFSLPFQRVSDPFVLLLSSSSSFTGF